MAKEVVLRRLTCHWPDCGLVFYICNSCYRGHRYCGKTCRKKARREQRRRANRRYRQSLEARLDHRRGADEGTVRPEEPELRHAPLAQPDRLRGVRRRALSS